MPLKNGVPILNNSREFMSAAINLDLLVAINPREFKRINKKAI